MNLGIFLPMGESMADMAAHGQDVRFSKLYLAHYCKYFKQVYLFSYAVEKYAYLPKNCVLITPPFALHRYLYTLLMPFIYRRVVKQCDVFRCFHPTSAIPAVLSKLLYGKKFIFNYNYDYTKWAVIEQKSWLVPFMKLSQAIIFKAADHVFVSDEKMLAYAHSLVGKSKVTLIRNAVDVRLFHRQKVKRAPKAQIILSIGRLEKQKNYHQLINAVALLKSKKVTLTIIGRGSLRASLLNQATQKRVKLTIIDVVPHDKLPEILHTGSIYVQPSLIEAPVKTLLEAMSCGLPCVATDVPGIQDVIQHEKNGLLVPLKTKALAKSIQALLENTVLAKKLGNAASKTIETKYNLQHFLTLETSLLKSL